MKVRLLRYDPHAQPLCARRGTFEYRDKSKARKECIERTSNSQTTKDEAGEHGMFSGVRNVDDFNKLEKHQIENISE